MDGARSWCGCGWWVQAVYKDDGWLLFMGFLQGCPALAAFVWSMYPPVLAKF
jgi:hypothetical protein